jgi:hypothetical protein
MLLFFVSEVGCVLCGIQAQAEETVGGVTLQYSMMHFKSRLLRYLDIKG